MKNRDYKEFVPNEIYHVYNRGVDKMEIFKDAQDYRIFLRRIEENIFPERTDLSVLSRVDKKRKVLPSNSFNLISFCLMPNHYHLVIQQLTDLPVSKLISKLSTSYSMYFNIKHERIGALFQDQFKAAHIETNEQLLWTCFYIHKNPLEAGLITDIRRYEWNSYLEYIYPQKEFLCKKEILLEQFNSKESFMDHFNKSLKSKEIHYKIAGFHDILLDF